MGHSEPSEAPQPRGSLPVVRRLPRAIHRVSRLSLLTGHLAFAETPAGSFRPIHVDQVQSETILVGKVHDELRRALGGVEVVVNRQDVRAITNAKGVFSLRVDRGDSTVGFRKIGYKPILLGLRPLPPANDTILVELVTSVVQLPDVIVAAAPSKPLRYAGTTKYDEVFQRRRIGLGTLITREVIDQRFTSSTADLLQGIPGVKVSNGPPKSVRFARCAEPGGVTVFIDGARQIAQSSSSNAAEQFESKNPSTKSKPAFHETPEVEMMSRVDPSQIEMIEVFRGLSEIPGVFHWNGCAVVAIWTRWNR